MRKWRSLTALRACEAVARTGSVSAAAAELHVTHPAISKQIALLEEDMGCALFERTGNRIRLTDAGQELYAGLKPPMASSNSPTYGQSNSPMGDGQIMTNRRSRRCGRPLL